MKYLRYCHTRTMDDHFILFTDTVDVSGFMAGLYAKGYLILSCGELQMEPSSDGFPTMTTEELPHEHHLRPLPDDLTLLLAQWPALSFGPPPLAVL